MFERFWLFHCGYVRVPEAFVLGGGSMRSRVVVPFMGAAAEHEEHGVVLLDAPYGHDGPRNAGSLLGRLLQWGVVEFERDWSIIPRLEQIGARPSQVDHILMTHLHLDHTGGMKELVHATFHVSAREWHHALSLTPVEAARQGYVLGDFRALQGRVESIVVPEELDAQDPGVDLFGDGSARAFSLPGHSVGHTGYLLQMRGGRRIFYLGDAVFSVRQITERRRFGLFPRAVGANMNQTLRTLGALQAWHERHPEVTLACAHDAALGERCMDQPITL